MVREHDNSNNVTTDSWHSTKVENGHQRIGRHHPARIAVTEQSGKQHQNTASSVQSVTVSNSTATRSASTIGSMAVVTPGRATRLFCDVWCFILCMLVMLIQLLVFDYYYLHYQRNEWWYAWIAGDVIVLGIMIWLLVIAIKYNRRCMQEVCTSDANIKFAFIGWLAYSLLLVGKVAVCMRMFYSQMLTDPVMEVERPLEYEINPQVWNVNGLRLNLGLSAVVFLFLVEAHHYTSLNSPRQTYLSYLQTVVTLDLFDSIYFLDILWLEKMTKNNWNLEEWVRIVILVFACINFVLPTFALLRLRYRRMPSWLLLPYEKMYSLLYVLLVNVPYLGIRIYLWVTLTDIGGYVPKFNVDDPVNPLEFKHQDDTFTTYDISIFILKNIIMIYIALKELYTRLQYYRQKRADEKGGELMGKHHLQSNDEDQHEI